MVSAWAHGRIRTLAILAGLAVVPGVAFAQAAITGLVTDPSGVPVAEVLVEASSTALIEKTRTATTDAGGRYRVEDLPPGTYQVMFTRQGWAPYRLEGIELSGSFTATANAALIFGGVTETIEVTAEFPAVDIHNAAREQTLTGEIIKSIPTVRSYNALLALVPGVLMNSNDVVTGTATSQFPVYGGRVNEGRLMLDGLNIGSPPGGNTATAYVVDVGAAQEVMFSSTGALGEAETGGVVISIVPSIGSNGTQGSIFVTGSSGALQSNNLTDALREQGVMAATPLTRVYDVWGALGGPIVRDRAWYYVNAHTGGSRKDSTNVYYNLNAGDPAKWLYSPDLHRREYSDRTFENASARITWQVMPRNTVSAFWDAQILCRTCTGATPGASEPLRVSPEAVGVLGRPLHVVRATWSSPVTDNLLVEAVFGTIAFGLGNFERDPNPTRDLIRVAEQCASGCSANGNVPGLVYRSQDFSILRTESYQWKGSISRVAGAHSLKAGYQHALMYDDRTWFTNSQNLTYRFDNGVPNQLTQSISPWVIRARLAQDVFFVQEQWTHRRLTLQAALRFDGARSWFPEQREGPSRFLPTPIVIPETNGVDGYKDLTPRFGAVYDFFGTGRTALKMSLGQYLEGASLSGNYGITNPSTRMPTTTQLSGPPGVTRAWSDANGNFLADCDLLNPAAQDLRPFGGDACGVMSNTSFGRNLLTNNFDPAILGGWGVRPSDWSLAVTVQHQVGPRSSLNVTYNRRWFRGFSVVDNRSLQPSDLTPFSIVAPSDPRLPGGGGYVVAGLYDVVPEKAGQIANLITDSGTYGRWYQYFHGIDVTLSVRSGRNLTFMAGTSTGQNVTNNCDVRAHLPELSTATTGTTAFGAGLMTSAVTPLSPHCAVASGFLTQFKGLSAYMIPRIDLHVAATFQSKPGAMLAANYTAPNSIVAQSLGRNLSGNAANVTVNLVPPGTMYGDRVNELNVRVAKVLRRGGSRTTIALEVYNAMNSSAVLSYNNAFIPGGAWLQPLTVLTPRFIKLGAELNF
jgi:hypothetical protein